MIASLPKIAVNGTSMADPQGAAVSQTVSVDKFSLVLALATHTSTSNAAVAVPATGERDRDDAHSSPGQGKSSSKSSLSISVDTATHEQSPEKSGEPSSLTMTPPQPTVFIESPITKADEAEVKFGVTTAADTSIRSAPVTSTILSPLPQGRADFTFKNAAPLASTLLTTSSFAGTSISVANVSGQQPEALSPDGPKRLSSTNTNFGFATEMIPTDATAGNTDADVPNTGASDTIVAPTSDKGAVAGGTQGVETKTSSVLSPAAHGEEAPQLPVTLPTVKSATVSPASLRSITAGSGKTAGKPDSMLVADSPANNAVRNDPKPETHAAEGTPHSTEHSSASPGESVDGALAATSQVVSTQESSATPSLPVVSVSQVPDTKLEVVKRVDGSAETSAADASVNTGSSPYLTQTVVARDNTKPQSGPSAMSQHATSPASGQNTSVAPENVTSKVTDASGTDAAQPHLVAVHNKVDANVTQNEASLDKPALHTADAEIPMDKPAVAAAYPSAFQSAKLIERLNQSELRVGIQAGEFGNLDIRTSMVRNQVTAEISVERGELSKVMAAELPSLQTRLSEQRLPVANIILQNQSSGGSAGFEQGSRQSQTMHQIATLNNDEASPAAEAVESNLGTSRLDVHM